MSTFKGGSSVEEGGVSTIGVELAWENRLIDDREGFAKGGRQFCQTTTPHFKIVPPHRVGMGVVSGQN